MKIDIMQIEALLNVCDCLWTCKREFNEFRWKFWWVWCVFNHVSEINHIKFNKSLTDTEPYIYVVWCSKKIDYDKLVYPEDVWYYGINYAQFKGCIQFWCWCWFIIIYRVEFKDESVIFLNEILKFLCFLILVNNLFKWFKNLFKNWCINQLILKVWQWCRFI